MNIKFPRAEIKIIKWKRAEKDYRTPFNIHFYFQVIVAPEFNKCFQSFQNTFLSYKWNNKRTR